MAQQKTIEIKNATTHNLKAIDLVLPRHKLIVVTGVSGSGKSSLVFDTLYAEGHRRYVESLSPYARQFLARMPRPPVDYIKGLSPAIAIEQRTHSANPRSTVGSITEVYDYLRLLFARLATVYSPVSGLPVEADSVTDVVDEICKLPSGTRFYLLTPFVFAISDKKYPTVQDLEVTLQKGYNRIFADGQVYEIEDLINGTGTLPKNKIDELFILVDRVVMPETVDDDFVHRMSDSVANAYNEGQGRCFIKVYDGALRGFSELFERDGMTFEKPTEALFNYNNPFGACSACEGSGRQIGYDPDLIIPNKSLTLNSGMVSPWRSSVVSNLNYRNWLKYAHRIDFPTDKPYYLLTDEQKHLLWNGVDLADQAGQPTIRLKGINETFAEYELQANKTHIKMFLAAYRGYTDCPVCGGSRLKKAALYCKIKGYTIADFLKKPISKLKALFESLSFNEYEYAVGKRIILEIQHRLDYLEAVGVGYLTLDRKAGTLSGGEAQRIQLSTSLSSNLTGSLYILDEPSIGLHPRDGEKLITVLERLRDLGNTVIVVEHDEAIMKRADFLVDIGPYAGELGGQVMVAGEFGAFIQEKASLTASYLNGIHGVPLPAKRRTVNEFIKIVDATEHNLKGITAKFPVKALTVVTGVSGSGKTTLVQRILYPGVSAIIGNPIAEKTGAHGSIDVPKRSVTEVISMNQRTLSKNARSNPVTYVGAYDHIRELYGNQYEAKLRGLKPGHFSFNSPIPGGRCDACQGEGFVVVEMQFMADVRLECEVCQGKRFSKNALEVLYKDKSIYDVLTMTVSEASDFFKDQKKIFTKLKALNDVGLGYVRLGQSTDTLSGGEGQRLKLASYLLSGQSNTLFILDEPTTGLHAYDIEKLMAVLNRLIEQSNTMVIIEHNLEVIKCADWVIDLGPEGGTEGGYLLFEGRPEDLVTLPNSSTGKYLKPKLTYNN